MGLINPTDWKGLIDLAVHASAGRLILVKEGTPMLVNHDAVFLQSSITIAVEFLGKESFRMAKWICRIVDDNIVIIFASFAKSVAHFGSKW